MKAVKECGFQNLSKLMSDFDGTPGTVGTKLKNFKEPINFDGNKLFLFFSVHLFK